MDQKVTPDVMTFVAECIIQFTENKPGIEFTSSEIEHSNYFVKNLPREFSKVPPTDLRARHEYDKWPAQIIQTLRFSKLLKDSGFFPNIEHYRDLYLGGGLTKTGFQELKKKFESFIIGHTNIAKMYEP